MSTHVDRNVADLERSISVVRGVLALIGAAVVLGSRSPGTGDASLIQGLGLPLAMAAFATALWWLPPTLRQLRVSAWLSASLLQILDVLAALGFAYVLSGVLADAAWAILTLPIVFASLRLNASGVLWVWLATSLGYIALLWADLLEPGYAAINTSLVLERPGILLAIAAAVALLTRWLQAGWAEQAQLTTEAQIRFEHVQVIERAGRKMRGRTPDEVVTTCLHHILELGFDAATATGANRTTRALGDGSLVPADQVVDPPAAGVVEITEWQGPGERVYSAAMLEPRSEMVISGWSAQPQGALQTDALSELVAHTTSSVELAQLLGQVRFEADHDALTGLANRAKFERRHREMAQEPTTIAMLFMDLDHFKQINDRYGHETGDWVLQQVGAVLSEEVGAGGLAARFGGDEFVAVVMGDEATAAPELADRVHAAVGDIANRSAVQHQGIEIGLSIGIAMAAGPVDPDELRRAADGAVFLAKDRGRGTTSTTWLSPTSVSSDHHPPVRAPGDHVASHVGDAG
ncbi:MAG: GGDEF domain-containing protein [Acidimicrobiia bacterium]|nr:GGDEF domain-containing protein [Acidimicrobiia bacterium]